MSKRFPFCQKCLGLLASDEVPHNSVSLHNKSILCLDCERAQGIAKKVVRFQVYRILRLFGVVN